MTRMTDYDFEVLKAECHVKEARLRLEGAEKLLAEAVLLRDNKRARALRLLADIAERRGTLRRYIPGLSVIVSELVCLDSPYVEIAVPPDRQPALFSLDYTPVTIERFMFDACRYGEGAPNAWKNGGAQWEYRL